MLPHFLYLGSYDHASRSDALKMLEITHILNVRPCNPSPSALLFRKQVSHDVYTFGSRLKVLRHSFHDKVHA